MSTPNLKSVNANLFKKVVFSDVIKLKSQLEIILDYPDRPKSNDKCPCVRERQVDLSQTEQCDHRGKDKSDPGLQSRNAYSCQ